jgi:hypothetical protein
MCACTETDVRESVNDCILASGEGHSSHRDTLHPICAARPMYSSAERSVLRAQRELSDEETVAGHIAAHNLMYHITSHTANWMSTYSVQYHCKLGELQNMLKQFWVLK